MISRPFQAHTFHLWNFPHTDAADNWIAWCGDQWFRDGKSDVSLSLSKHITRREKKTLPFYHIINNMQRATRFGDRNLSVARGVISSAKIKNIMFTSTLAHTSHSPRPPTIDKSIIKIISTSIICLTLTFVWTKLIVMWCLPSILHFSCLIIARNNFFENFLAWLAILRGFLVRDFFFLRTL